MKKKIIKLLSAAALSATVIFSAFTVNAVGTLKLQAVADKTTVKQGETITVDLEITENPGIATLQTQAVYDKNSFEIVSIGEKGDFTKNGEISYWEDSGIEPAGSDESTVMWVNENFLNMQNSVYTGKIFYVTFKVKETTADGDYTFSFEPWEDGAVDMDGESVATDFKGTTVTVSDGLSSDASLRSLTISNGTLTPAFSADIENYTVLLPYGSAVPSVSAVANDPGTMVEVAQAASFDTGRNNAVVTVTAGKGNKKIYNITFIEINAVLSSLNVNGTSVAGFAPNITEYTYELSYEDWKKVSDKTYAITATASKNTSDVSISDNNFTLTSTDPDSKIEKKVTVSVTSGEDAAAKTTYTITFTVRACVHDYKIDDTKSTAATCTEKGIEFSVCSICGKEKTEEAAALGHKWSAWSNAEGSENYTRKCANCGKTETRTVISAEDHKHDFKNKECQIEIIKEATCTQKGMRRIWCANTSCAGHLDEETDMIPHTEDSGTVSNGIKTYSCKICGAVIRTENVSGSDSGNSSSGGSTGGSTSSSSGGSTGSSSASSSERMSVKVKNNITGKTTTVVADKKANNTVNINLGKDNNGCYANIFTTGGEYLSSTLIEGGKAEFSIPENAKIKIEIDSIAYGDSVASEAGIYDSAEFLSDNMRTFGFVMLFAGISSVTVFILKKRVKK